MSLERNRGAKRAREARKEFGLDPVAPLACLLDCVEEHAELPVVVTPLGDGVAGACTRGPLLWVNGAQAAVRQRFTLAHELGHVRCGHDGRLVVDTNATLTRSTEPREVEANAFAAEFLIPKAALKELSVGADPTLDELVVIAAHYGTSAEMTLYRFDAISEPGRAALKAAIERGEHHQALARLGLSPIADRLRTLGALPYLSPRIRDGHLGAMLRGEAEAPPEYAAALARLFG